MCGCWRARTRRRAGRGIPGRVEAEGRARPGGVDTAGGQVRALEGARLLTRAGCSACPAGRPRRPPTALHSSGSAGLAPCAAPSANRGFPRRSPGTPRSACVWVGGPPLPSIGRGHSRWHGTPRAPCPPTLRPLSPMIAGKAHMMKAVTPMAQMSVCGTAPWPSRSSGAGREHREGALMRGQVG